IRQIRTVRDELMMATNKKPKERPLSPKQWQFVQHYVKTSNATESYKRAYKVESDNVAAVCAHKLLRTAKISNAVKEAIAEQGEITQEWINNRLRIEAKGDGPDTTSGSRTKATELLGKRTHYFPPEERNIKVAGFITKIDLETAQKPETQAAAKEFIKYIDP